MCESSIIKCIFNRCGFPQKLNNALKAHYDYWDEFVKCWLNYKFRSLALSDIKGWSIPNFSQHRVNLAPTIDYLPEVWWGLAVAPCDFPYDSSSELLVIHLH